MVLLLLLGLGLSRVALRAAHAGESGQSGRAEGMAAWLRGTYRVVLWLCCLYYYLSLPLLVLLVVGAVAGIVLFFLFIGSQNFASGLKHVIRRSVEFDFHIESTLNEVIEEKRALTNLYTYAPGERSDDIERAMSEALEAEPSPFDSHPSPRQRLDLVNELGADAPEDPDDGPAWDPFKDRGYLEKEMTHVVRQRVEAAHGVVIAPG